MVFRQRKDGAIESHVKPERDIIPVRLNDEERELLKKAKEILEQPKDSTAIKQLAMIGYFVIQRPETSELLGIVFANKRKNKRTGIVEYAV